MDVHWNVCPIFWTIMIKIVRFYEDVCVRKIVTSFLSSSLLVIATFPF